MKIYYWVVPISCGVVAWLNMESLYCNIANGKAWTCLYFYFFISCRKYVNLECFWSIDACCSFCFLIFDFHFLLSANYFSATNRKSLCVQRNRKERQSEKKTWAESLNLSNVHRQNRVCVFSFHVIVIA